MFARRFARAVLVAASIWLWLAGARAELVEDDVTRNTARELAREGLDFMEQGAFDKAADRLERAYALVPAPTIAVLHGESLERLGKLIEAAERYEQARRTGTGLGDDAPEAFREAVATAKQKLDALRPRIPRVTIRLEGTRPDAPGVSVRLDGEPVPAALIGVEGLVNPGAHELELFLDGRRVETRTFEIAEGAQHRELLVLRQTRDRAAPDKDAAADPSSSGTANAQRTLGFVSLGVGGAGLAVGVASGLIMLERKKELDARCPGNVCHPADRDTVTAFRVWRATSFVGYGVGILGIAAGGVLLFTLPKSKERAAYSVELGAGSVSASVHF